MANFFSQFPIRHIRLQYEVNLSGLRMDLERARRIAPQKVRGFTVDELAAKVERFEQIVAMTDEELDEHRTRVMGSLEPGT